MVLARRAEATTRSRGRSAAVCAHTMTRSPAKPCPNLRAWLYTILRNEFYSQMRKKGREIEDVDGAYSRNVGVHPDQPGHLDMADMHAALAQLPPDQREA